MPLIPLEKKKKEKEMNSNQLIIPLHSQVN